MKLKDGFIMRDVAGETVVLPTGDVMDVNMMITLNDTGKFLWQQLETGAQMDDLVQAMLAEYEVDEQTARSGIERFVTILSEKGFLDE